jgi:hypothetical protein
VLRNFRLLILSLAFLSVSVAMADGQREIYKIAHVLQIAQPGDWIFLDLDNTLIKEVSPDLSMGPSRQALDNLPVVSAVDGNGKTRYYRWAEPNTGKTVEELQANGSKAFVLTARSWNQLSGTIQAIQGLKLDFSHSHPEFPDGRFEARLTFHAGVIFSGSTNKGEALLTFLRRLPGPPRFARALFAFLKLLPERPKRIIFVDDRDWNIRDVEQAFQQSEIPVVTLLYKGATLHSVPVCKSLFKAARTQRASE